MILYIMCIYIYHRITIIIIIIILIYVYTLFIIYMYKSSLGNVSGNRCKSTGLPLPGDLSPHAPRNNLYGPKGPSTKTFQNPLIKECTLNHIRDRTTI